jgi:hypothetical protein
VGQFGLENQIHDYSPPIAESGLFWITPIPRRSVEVNLRRGTAALAVEDLDTPDWFTLLNSLRGGETVPAEVTFDVRWGNVLRRLDLRDETVGFTGEFIETEADIEWSVSQDGFEFESDPFGTSQSVFAVIGRERNGVFFR